MKFRSFLTFAALGALLSLTVSSRAHALVMAPSPIYQRVAQSDLVVIGKVVGFAKNTVKAKRFPGQPMPTEYMIAIVKVEDPILNKNGLTEVRVGVLPLPPAPPPRQPGLPQIGGRRPPGWGQFRPKQGEKFMLFLREHHSAPMYETRAYFDFVNLAKITPTIKKQIAEAKEFAKLMSRPMEGLQSKNADTRFKTAAMMLAHYRRYPQGKRKEVAIEAKESELILKGLLDGNWDAPYRYGQLHPRAAFQMLGLQQKDGWKYPRQAKEFAPAAKKWIQANAKTFRIKKLMPADAS